MWKEFGIQTTFDTAVNSPVKVSQSQTDRDIAGDLVNLRGSDLVHEYRAMINNPVVIPFIRSNRKDFPDIIPLGAIKRNNGYLIIGGMKIESDSDFYKICACIDKFIDWISKP